MFEVPGISSPRKDGYSKREVQCPFQWEDGVGHRDFDMRGSTSFSKFAYWDSIVTIIIIIIMSGFVIALSSAGLVSQ